jgi:hypothetical protein
MTAAAHGGNPPLPLVQDALACKLGVAGPGRLVRRRQETPMIVQVAEKIADRWLDSMVDKEFANEMGEIVVGPTRIWELRDYAENPQYWGNRRCPQLVKLAGRVLFRFAYVGS